MAKEKPSFFRRVADKFTRRKPTVDISKLPSELPSEILDYPSRAKSNYARITKGAFGKPRRLRVIGERRFKFPGRLRFKTGPYVPPGLLREREKWVRKKRNKAT